MLGYAIPLLAGLSIAAIIYSALSLFFSSERQVQKQLESLTDYESGQAAEVEPLLMPFSERVLRPASALSQDAARIFGPSDYAERIRRRLVMAGNPHGLDAERLLAIKAGTAIAGVVVVLLIGTLSAAVVGNMILGAIIFAVVGFYLPDIWLRNKVSTRQLEIRRTLPDMLDMLTISVEAGMGFDAAVAKITASRPGALSEEFGRMLQEIQAGVSRREAMRHMGERTDVPELRSFIMSMIQADVFGVSVSNVLRTQSRDMRVKRRQLPRRWPRRLRSRSSFL
jgi:tight adherence protein C